MKRDVIMDEDEKHIDAVEIVCPYCRYIHEDPEQRQGFVTCWGEDGPKEYDCSSCDKKFMVTENVSRSFTMTPMVQEERK